MAQQVKKLLLLILDGASDESLFAAETPFFDSALEQGFSPACGLAPVPTITYGNHATIMTGRFPGGSGGHGIIGNLFRDPVTGAVLNMDDHDLCEYVHAATIYELLNKDGLPRILGAAVAEPVCRGADYTDPMAQYFKLSPLERDNHAAGITLDFISEKNPDFFAVNFLSVDAAGENHGPRSAEYKMILEQADSHARRIVETWRNKTGADVHYIVTADHGMHTLERTIDLPIILEIAGVDADVAASHRSAHVYLTRNEDIEKAKNALVSCGAFKAVYSREELPTLKLDHPRSGDIFVLAAPGVEIQKPGLLGSHGSSEPEETRVPFILGGPMWRDISQDIAGKDAIGLENIASLIRAFFDR